MTASYKTAYKKLVAAQEELKGLDFGNLSNDMRLRVLEVQQDIYAELQAFQVQRMAERNQQYSALTAGFRQSEEGFRRIQTLALEAKQSGEVMDGLLKGLSLILSIL